MPYLACSVINIILTTVKLSVLLYSELDPGLEEAINTILWAAPRLFTEIPELREVRVATLLGKNVCSSYDNSRSFSQIYCFFGGSEGQENLVKFLVFISVFC